MPCLQGVNRGTPIISLATTPRLNLHDRDLVTKLKHTLLVGDLQF